MRGSFLPNNGKRVVTGKFRPHIPALGGLLVLALMVFGRVLGDASQVLSSGSGEVASRFLYARGFAATEILGGNFPLWNPFLYSGTPFLADFSSALLYPPNLIFLFAPLSLAVSWTFAIHVFLLGAGVYAWAVTRGMGKPASFVAGAAAMFSATVMMPIHAGHLPDVCSLAWTPLIFVGMDRWMAERRWGWLVMAAGAAAFQIYAGQVVYFVLGAVVAGGYALTFPWKEVSDRRTAAAGLVLIYPGAIVLGAAQVFPGLAAVPEWADGGATGAGFSMAAENFLTLVAPWFFGRVSGLSPAGGASNVFGGLAVLVLAVFGLWNAGRVQWRWVILLVGTGLLATGVWVPVGRLVFVSLPGLAEFQGTRGGGFFFGIFLAFSAGLGVKALWSKKSAAPWPAVFAGGLAILLLLASMALRHPFAVDWLEGAAGVSSAERSSAGEGEVAPRAVALQAAGALRHGGFFLAGYAVLWGWGFRRRGGRVLLILVAVGEVFFFARSTVVSFPLQPALYEPVRQALWNIPGDFRILNLFSPNANMLLKREGLWGDEQAVLRRYSRLFASVRQGGGGPMEEKFARPHPIWEMFRCAFQAVPDGNTVKLVNTGKPYPRFYFVSEYEVMEPDNLLETLAGPDGEWRQKILLEEEPIPAPSGKNSRVHLSVRDVSINHYTLEIVADAASILVNTDSYARDWRAVSLPGSAQIVYRVLPVNYSQRGIPLTAGSHLLRLEYRPSGLAEGSLLTLGALVVLAGWFSFPVWSRYLGASGIRGTEAES